jgi:hypothetical protein
MKLAPQRLVETQFHLEAKHLVITGQELSAKACSFLMRPDAALDTPDVSLHAEGWIDAFLKASYVLIETSLQTLKINRRRRNGRFAGALLGGLLCSFLGWGFSRGHCFSPGVSVSAIA